MIIQTASTVGVSGRSLMIVGSEIKTMFESRRAMKVAIEVFVRTMYLYCKANLQKYPIFPNQKGFAILLALDQIKHVVKRKKAVMRGRICYVSRTSFASLRLSSLSSTFFLKC